MKNIPLLVGVLLQVQLAQVFSQWVAVPYTWVGVPKYPPCNPGFVAGQKGTVWIYPGEPEKLPIPNTKDCELDCDWGFPCSSGRAGVVKFDTSQVPVCYDLSVPGCSSNQTVHVDCNGELGFDATLSLGKYLGFIQTDACGGALWADGKSEAKVRYEPPDPNIPGALPLPPPITWTIPINPSGAIITSNSSTMATVRAGMRSGTIRIRASSGNCFVEMDLDVVDPREGGGGGCPGSCPANTSSFPGQTPPIFGGGWHNLSSRDGASFELSLGNMPGGDRSRSLILDLSSPSTLTFTPTDFKYPWSRRNVNVIPQDPGEALQQIRVPDGLAVISPDANEVNVSFFANTNVGPQGSNGYTWFGNPLVTWRFAAAAVDDEMIISEIRPGENTRVSGLAWATDVWRFTRADAATEELFVSASGNVRTETVVMKAGGVTNRVGTKQYTVYPAGERLTLEVPGTGPDAHTNTYSHYTNGLLERVVRDDGSWEHYFYDAQMRPVQIFSAFGNQGPTTETNLCRLVEHSYDTNLVSAFNDAGVYHPSSPRRTTERWLGQTVSVRFLAYTHDKQWEVRSLSGDLSGKGNLTNITKLHTRGFFYGEPKSVEHADATMEFHERTYGGTTTNYTNIVSVGVPNSGKTAIVDGTKTVTVKSPLGQLISVTTTDIASTNKVIGQQLYGAFDMYSRPQAVTNLDGTWEYSARFCCGDTVTTNREGTVTTKTYDVLNRLLTTKVNGATHSNTYDAAGSVVRVERIGTNGNVIVVERHSYDTAGHRTATTNAIGEVTLFTEAHGLSGTTNITTRLTNSSSGPQRTEARYLDGQTKSITGGLAHPVRYEYGPTVTNGGGTFTKEIKLAASGSDTDEWTIQFYDLLGRPSKTLYADGASSQTFYNSKGQATNSIDPDGVSRLTSYNALGQPAFTAIDSNLNAAIDLSGNDRVQRTTNYVANNGVADVHRSLTYQLSEGGSEVLVSTAESSVDGLRSWSITDSGTSSMRTFYPVSGVRTQMNWRVDGSYASNYFVHGRLMGSTHFDSAGSQLGATTFAYDAHGRQIQSADARNGATTNSFNSLDRVISTTTPGPFYLQTQTQYDSLGRAAIVTYPDNRSVTNEYFASGELKKTSGARTYPVEYAYDAQGRMKTMKTWQEFGNDATAAMTGWTNDPLRGWLNAKGYADGKGPSYSYTSAGRLSQRTWARGTTTSYAMNAFGDIERITYSDNTGNVTNTYDRRGRVTGVNSGSNLTTRLYSDSGLLLSETQNGLVVSNRYDELLRRTNVAVVVGGSVVASTGYGYDSAGRLSTVIEGTNSATYSYIANSPLVSQIVFQQNATTRMTTSKSYDYLNRLLLITNHVAAAGAESPAFAYALNTANQRTAITNADASRWLYGYDALGQVTNGTKRWNDGSTVLGQQFGYLFDDIGNRKNAVSGGDSNGLHLRLQTYSANSLNQYTSRTVPGWVDVLGTATNTSTVTVNNTAASRKGDYYRAEVSAPNSGAVWPSITNVAVLASGTNDYVTNWTGNVFVPKTPEAFGYDLDGNMTSDGRWLMTWDGENRLVSMTSHADGPSGSRLSLHFGYDAQSRRISKVVSNWTGSAWVRQSDERFVYDGWNLLGVLNASNNTVISSFVWGLDLSGSMQGAGGVGGLLAIAAAGAGTHFAGFDGNGNLALLVSAGGGAVTAHYEYDPFGRLLRATGPLASLNPFRFSTKYTDDESSFNYYGYRFYNATEGRWPSRDPINEKGTFLITWKSKGFNFNEEQNLYRFVKNDSIERFDSDGRALWELPRRPIVPPVPNDEETTSHPPLPPFTPGGRWQVCCRSVRGWAGAFFVHCDHRQGPCDPDPDSIGYPIVRQTSCCNSAIKSDADMSLCLRKNPSFAGNSPGDNCQSSTREALEKCCAKSTWKPHWYAYQPIPYDGSTY